MRAVDHAQRHALAPGRRDLAAGVDPLERLGLVAAPGGEHRPGLINAAVPVACDTAADSSSSVAAAAYSPACTWTPAR